MKYIVHNVSQYSFLLFIIVLKTERYIITINIIIGSERQG